MLERLAQRLVPDEAMEFGSLPDEGTEGRPFLDSATETPAERAGGRARRAPPNLSANLDIITGLPVAVEVRDAFGAVQMYMYHVWRISF